MKDKWIKTVSVLLVVSGMTACGMEQSAKQIAEGTNTAQVDMNDIFNNVSQTGDVAVPQQQQAGEIQALNRELFDGQSIRIWKGKGNILLVLKEDEDMLYLYDVASAQIRGETKTKNWQSADVYPYHGGYCVIGGITNEDPDGDIAAGGEAQLIEVVRDSMEHWGVFYDDSLKETRSILLNDIVENADIAVWSVSTDGTMLGCYDLWEGLNIYDLKGEKIAELLGKGKESKCPELLGVNAIFFDADNSQVIFTGQTDQNGSSAASWGRSGIDGTGLENHILECDLGAATGYGDGKLLLGEDSIFFQGGMGFVDTETGKAVYHKEIGSALPVSGPFFSDDGTVFATAALDTYQLEVSIWRTEDFSLIHKDVIRDDREEMFYRSPQICLFPDLRACMVCMGGQNDIPQEAVLLKY